MQTISIEKIIVYVTIVSDVLLYDFIRKGDKS